MAGRRGQKLCLSHLLCARDSQRGLGIPRSLYAVNTMEAAATAAAWGSAAPSRGADTGPGRPALEDRPRGSGDASARGSSSARLLRRGAAGSKPGGPQR